MSIDREIQLRVKGTWRSARDAQRAWLVHCCHTLAPFGISSDDIVNQLGLVVAGSLRCAQLNTDTGTATGDGRRVAVSDGQLDGAVAVAAAGAVQGEHCPLRFGTVASGSVQWSAMRPVDSDMAADRKLSDHRPSARPAPAIPMRSSTVCSSVSVQCALVRVHTTARSPPLSSRNI